MSGGLQIQGSYQYIIRAESSSYFTLRTGPEMVKQSSPVHAVKVNWSYELPFGQGKKWGGSASRGLNAVIGGWSFDGNGRIQSGNILDYGNVRLVGWTDQQLQDNIKVYQIPDATNPKITRVYMLPQDFIANTILAYQISATSATGYSGAVPTGAYFAPINSDPGCLQVYRGACGNGGVITPSATPTHRYVNGPMFVRFDHRADQALRHHPQGERRAAARSAERVQHHQLQRHDGVRRQHWRPPTRSRPATAIRATRRTRAAGSCSSRGDSTSSRFRDWRVTPGHAASCRVPLFIGSDQGTERVESRRRAAGGARTEACRIEAGEAPCREEERVRVHTGTRLAFVVALTAAVAGVASGQGQQQPLPPPPAQQPLPTFRSAVTLVPVDVRVVDRNGAPITDLKAEEFSLYEDGVKQDVRHFSVKALAAEAPAADDKMALRQSTLSFEPQTKRIFLVVLGRG